MRLRSAFTTKEISISRIETFSDAVFAIAATLLILDIKVPELEEHKNIYALAHGLWDYSDEMMAWAIGFIYICKFWLDHHHTLFLAGSANMMTVLLNIFVLLGISFVPYSIAVMGQYPHNPVSLSFFGAVAALNLFLLFLLKRHVLRCHAKPNLIESQAVCPTYVGIVGPLLYIVAATLTWINFPIAYALYILVPILGLFRITRS